MSTRNAWASATVLSLAMMAATASSAQGFGTPASEADIEKVTLTVMPDGEGLPEGSGGAEQGAAVYAVHCASCHGADGEGGLANQLVGGRGTLGSDQPVKTLGSYWPYATTVFNYLRRSMPYTQPMSLSNDEYYALTAFLLNKNDIISADRVLDKDSLPAVVMPNRDGFVDSYPTIPAQYDYFD